MNAANAIAGNIQCLNFVFPEILRAEVRRSLQLNIRVAPLSARDDADKIFRVPRVKRDRAH